MYLTNYKMCSLEDEQGSLPTLAFSGGIDSTLGLLPEARRLSPRLTSKHRLPDIEAAEAAADSLFLST
jgi:hypothetical protein